MSRPTPSRRSLLRALGPAGAVAVAGCGGLGGSLGSEFDGRDGQSGDCEAVDVEPPDPVSTEVTTTGDDAEVDASVQVHNRSDTAHEVTVSARPEGGYRNVFEARVAVEGTDRSPGNLGDGSISDAGPGTYVVTAATDTGLEGRTTWRVRPGRPASLTAVVTEGRDVVFEESVGCGEGCVARTSPDSVVLPYETPGGDPLYEMIDTAFGDDDVDPATLTIENRTDHDRTLALELLHDGTRLLRYDGRVRRRGRVRLPDLVARTGEFEVRVATLSGACLGTTWSLPEYSARAVVRFTPEWGLDFGCNPGYNTHFGVENRAGRHLDPVIELRRKGTLVQRRSLDLAAGENGTFVRSYPIGGVYRLGVATDVGHAWTEVDLCCLRSGNLTIRLTPEGPTFQQTCGDEQETTSSSVSRGTNTADL